MTQKRGREKAGVGWESDLEKEEEASSFKQARGWTGKLEYPGKNPISWVQREPIDSN